MASAPVATVATGHTTTTAAARTVLEAGGNAFDGVVAAGFASSVVEPMLASVAGGGFCLVRPADGGAEIIDFFVDVPGRGLAPGTLETLPETMIDVAVEFASTTQGFQVGWASMATPGCLDGWLHIHDRFGRLPLADVVAPAVAAAAAGVVVNEQQGYLFRILAPTNRTDLTTAGRFVPGGTPLATGETLHQPDVADFLRALGDDTDRTVRSFRAALAESSAAGGGPVTHDDLDAYRVVDRKPLSSTHRGRRVLTNPSPAIGGRLVLAQLDALASGPPLAGWDDPAGLRRIIEAQEAADRLRTSASTQGTTHISVADTDGNVATMTTSNGSGAGCTVPGFGVLGNNMLGEDDLFPHGLAGAVPGTRVPSMMSPTIVLDDDDVVLALGSGGSKRIRTALAQVIARSIEHEPDLARAVTGPRLHWDGEVVQAEPGHDRRAMAELSRHAPVHEWADLDLYFGGVHAIRPGTDAVGDPRRGGSAAVFPVD